MGEVKPGFWAGLTHRSADFAFPQKKVLVETNCAQSGFSVVDHLGRQTKWGVDNQHGAAKGGRCFPGTAVDWVRVPGLTSRHSWPGPALRVKHHHCRRERGAGRGRTSGRRSSPSPPPPASPRPLRCSQTPSSLPPDPDAAAGVGLGKVSRSAGC